MKNMKGVMNVKILSAVISLILVGMVVAAGPASAFSLGIKKVGSNYVPIGELAKAEIGIKMKNGDQYVPVNKISFQIIPLQGYHGEGDLYCDFDVYGNPLTDCEGITVIPSDVNVAYGEGMAQFQNENFNFGFGYGVTDDFGYRLVFDTNKYKVGNYDGQFRVYVGPENEELFSSKLRGIMHILAE